MKVICLGGAGKICRESALDLVLFGNFEKITVADYNYEEATKVAEWLKSQNKSNAVIDSCLINVFEKEATVTVLKEYDIVMDGTTISLNKQSTECIAEAGCHGINLNGFGEEYDYNEVFKSKGKIMVPGFGMTPGTTNMMAVRACEKLDSVKSIRVSHGSFRPIAFSKSIAETTTYEYDPELPGRTVYEDGQFIQVPPLARERVIELPEPYGTLPQYIIPHSETFTLSKYLKGIDKEPGLIEVRGTWPAKNMRLVKALYEWGFMKNEKISVGAEEVGIMDCIAQYLINSEQGKTTEIYGYALHVEVEGVKDGKSIRYTLWHTHPASDGSVAEWEGLRAYTRNVGIPVGVAVNLMAQGRIKDVAGAVIPELVFNPEDVISELAKRDIYVHEKVETIAE